MQEKTLLPLQTECSMQEKTLQTLQTDCSMQEKTLQTQCATHEKTL